MIWDLLEWVALLDQQSLHNLAALKSNLKLLSSKSDLFVFVIYIVTFRKTYAYCMGFFFCMLLNDNAFFGMVNYTLSDMEGEQHDKWYGLLWWCGLSLTWICCVILHLITTKNKSLLFWCATMMTIQMLMAWDWYANTYNAESFLSENYTSIAVCIHVCICLSFYRPAKITNSIADVIFAIRIFFVRIFVMPYFWYTSRSRRNNQRLLCKVKK